MSAVQLRPSLVAAFVFGIGTGFFVYRFLSRDDRPLRSSTVLNGIHECIGQTPLIRINSLSYETGCEIYAKVEYMNPGGSPKDRVALAIIEAAEDEYSRQNSGKLESIYEGTAGSTGISLAMLARAKQYTPHIFLSLDQSIEKVQILSCLGAKTKSVRPASIVDDKHFVNSARIAALDDPNGVFADQFENEANWKCHFSSTGPEIYDQAGGNIDYFISGAGTGGTITGVGKFLKSKLQSIKVVLADPQGSSLFNRVKHGILFNQVTEKEGSRRRNQVDSIVEGIGINRIVKNFAVGEKYIDDAIQITDEEAVAMGRYLVVHDGRRAMIIRTLLINAGIFVGSSSAVNCCAAVRCARKAKKGSVIVTILCDSGSRHLCMS